jgi:OOP family OmpA-OmpF porin
MKTIKSLMTLVAILALSFSVQAQDADNHFTFSTGFTGVDAFPTNATNDYAGALFQDFFKAADNWNVAPSVTYIQGTYYLENGFSVALRGSASSISKLGTQSVKESYVGADASIRYNFLSDTKFDPYVLAGAGKYWMGDFSSGTINLGAGLNVWITDHLGLTYDSTFKHTPTSYGVSHFQHAFGIVIR